MKVVSVCLSLPHYAEEPAPVCLLLSVCLSVCLLLLLSPPLLPWSVLYHLHVLLLVVKSQLLSSPPIVT